MSNTPNARMAFWARNPTVMAGMMLLGLAVLLAVATWTGLPDAGIGTGSDSAIQRLFGIVATVISALIFVVTREFQREQQNRCIVIIGSAFLGVALLDFVHSSASPDLPALPMSPGSGRAFLCWLAARLLAAVALVFVACCDWDRSASVAQSRAWTFGSLGLVAGVLWIAAIVDPIQGHWLIMGMEVLIAGLSLAAAAGFYRQAITAPSGDAPGRPFDPIALMTASGLMAIAGAYLATSAPRNGYNGTILLAFNVVALWFVYRGIADDRMIRARWNATWLTQSNQRLEAEVVERTRQLEAMYDAAVNSIITIDPTGTIQSLNAATIGLLGYSREELVGQNVRMIMPEPYAGRHDNYLQSYLATGRKKIIGIGREVIARRKDGTTFPIHLSVSEFEVNGRHYFTGIIIDLSERRAAEMTLRETERQLAQAQKMEVVGQLTGGLAHDFNNLLTVITGNLELLDMRVEGREERDLIRRADEAARMGARLTGRLLTFSRRRALQPTVLNLNDTTVGMTELLRRTLGENVSVMSNLAPNLWNTRVDASEVENAVLNLAINARDAMPSGGRIVIETANLELGADDIAHVLDARPGPYVRLSVSDNGTGMPPEVVARAFEPFYTTKDAGRGTGLGLSTVYGFVKQSGGYAAIYSEVGKGTTVSIHLPRDASAGPSSVEAFEQEPSPTPVGEIILVVEDNEQVRQVTVRRLDALGYSILIAEDGAAAIAMLEQSRTINLVFSDVVMPGHLSGFDVLEWVKQHRPEVKVLLTSGFSREMANQGSAADPGIKLLRKPYTQIELARAVRDALRNENSV